MEKFGLFDLIEKFNATAAGGNAAKKSDNGGEQKDGKKVTNEDIVGAPPQLVMNTKMRDFLARHDAAVAEIRKPKPKKKVVKKRAASPRQTKKVTERNTKQAENAQKKGRGRPKKDGQERKNTEKTDL